MLITFLKIKKKRLYIEGRNKKGIRSILKPTVLKVKALYKPCLKARHRIKKFYPCY